MTKFNDEIFDKKASVLERALKIAQDNEFDLENWYYKYMIIQTHDDFPSYPFDPALILLNKAENLLLFDHDFCKALFPYKIWKNYLSAMATDDNGPINYVEWYLSLKECSEEQTNFCRIIMDEG
jgi:hypothetical protein